MKNITLLGATGSIGVQTLEVIQAHPEQFSIHALAFGKQIDVAIPLIKTFQPKKVVVQDVETRNELKTYLPELNILVGVEGAIEVSTDSAVDVVVNAVMGSIGLAPTLQAIEANKTIAIANKETLVTAGHLVTALAKRQNVHLLPIDSEHSAIFQCLQGESEKAVNRLVITASGGSFRDYTRDQLEGVTVKDALKHPNWSMGAKITVDSASMMNKGLEVIEAYWLFGMDYDKIDVILHKESVIHSMVEFADRSVIAQLGLADMRIPIQYALTYPNRLRLEGAEQLDLAAISRLNFRKMDFDRFPCLKMAYQAGKIGGSTPTVLNAANEQAVSLFLDEQISFLDIERLIEKMLDQHQNIVNPDLATIQAIDLETRRKVLEQLKR
ncbi:1-deoxy-D-xylulose-5-phosphate reductoisomerase [Amphibacillus cookii]|uniref:1-deoxy-D-xylulose-5-phosphate reductoisomerase n=1 Tax=Amphibacillus cookii TaxID=767787 RepID=UPI00195EA225|nr:1-deoxy-D-xylulose-5-phosphate reductoisomerase [Amphibacillus cookii]MBM7540606.1 1-deoxy-D-xylulose-5-phosphate reductoisomerase [Amphibacillus cookii]